MQPPAAVVVGKLRSIARILVIEDSEAVQALLLHMLGQAGYADTTFYGSIERAIEALRTEPADLVPDLILTDVVLPGTDGITGVSLMKELPALFEVPIIVMTGVDNDEFLERAFSAGAHDFIRKPFRKAELLCRIGAALRLRAEMERRRGREEELITVNEQLTLSNIDLAIKSSIDGLTHLSNRWYMDTYFDGIWKEAVTASHAVGLVILDVDFFKNYNDVYGHPSGDKVLKQVADVIDSSLIRNGDLAARYGGEEFALILPGTDIEGCRFVAERIRTRVQALHIPHEKGVNGFVTVSAGCATTSASPPATQQKLLEAADAALYRAKAGGRNCVVCL